MIKSTDKFLLGIVGGVLLLVVVAFVVTYLRPKPSYQPDDTPDGVAHNYLLALQQKDYARAYTYLSPTLKGYPANLEVFVSNVNQLRWNFQPGGSAATFAIASTQLVSETAIITVEEFSYYNSGLLARNPDRRAFDMRLRREQNAWKIVSSSAYWAFCWDAQGGCK